jgi:uncharacterized protein YbaR (Trm112 family)
MNSAELKPRGVKAIGKKKLLPCPVCRHASYLRANVMQDVDVTVDKDGSIENGFDFSSPEIDDSGELYCSKCGSHLRLNWTERRKHHLVLDE